MVLKKPIVMNDQGVVQSAKASMSSKLDPVGITTVFGHHNIRQVSLFSQYVQGVSSAGIGPLNNESKEEYTYLIHLEETHVHEFLSQVKALDDYVHVQPNFTYTTFTGVDEPAYDSHQKTGFELMGFPSAWPHSTGNGVVVAVLDTGINITHEEFCKDSATIYSDNQIVVLNNCTKLVGPYDFIDGVAPGVFNLPLLPVNGADYNDEDGFPEDKDGHGTHVAGIIAAKVNGSGMSGAAYGAQIMPIRVLAPYKYNGRVISQGNTSHIIQGINYAVENGADIINMSLGGTLGTDDDQLMRTAIDQATLAGVLVVAATGNDCLNFDDAKVAPAYFENAMSVASVNKNGEVSAFSNYGESLDVAAWGGQGYCDGSNNSYVYSAHIPSNNSYKPLAGTSMAAPFVSALAAIIKSYYKNEKNMTLTPAEIRHLIQISAQRNSDEKTLTKGHGIIDAKKALAFSGVSELMDSNDQNLYYGSDGHMSSLVCYPNPFKMSALTTCEFYLSAQSTFQSWIYSRRGQLIHSTSSRGVGKQTITWDGRDRNSSVVPNGVYQMVLNITPESSSHSPKTLRHLITVLR